MACGTPCCCVALCGTPCGAVLRRVGREVPCGAVWLPCGFVWPPWGAVWRRGAGVLRLWGSLWARMGVIVDPRWILHMAMALLTHTNDIQ